MITYAIGDIHGRSDCLKKLFRLIGYDMVNYSDRGPFRIVTLGDYVDRGEDSKGVLDLLAEGVAGAEMVSLRGNHEAMLSAYLEDGDPDLQKLWLQNNGPEFLFPAAGVDLFYSAQALRKDMRQKARSHIGSRNRAMLQGLKNYHFDPALNIVFVHAGVRPGVPLEDQTERDLTSIREDFFNEADTLSYVVVHGHTTSRFGPDLVGNRINLDTGAYRTAVLTAAAFDTAEPGLVRFLQTNGTAHGTEARYPFTDPAGRPIEQAG